MPSTSYNQVGDYIPRQDEAFRLWGVNFVALVSDDPEHYGLSPTDVLTLETWTAEFVSALNTAVAPSTRTSTTVRHKNEMRRRLELLYRMWAQQIKHLALVTDSERRALGLHMDDPRRMRIGRPATPPVLQSMLQPAGRHMIRYSDNPTVHRIRKPRGVAHLQLYAAVAETMVADVNLARHIGDFGRQPIFVDWDAREAGRTATYFGRWVTRRGLTGPWSVPRPLMIVGAGVGLVDRRHEGRSGGQRDLIQMPRPAKLVRAITKAA